jgi:hypothetical protein
VLCFYPCPHKLGFKRIGSRSHKIGEISTACDVRITSPLLLSTLRLTRAIAERGPSVLLTGLSPVSLSHTRLLPAGRLGILPTCKYFRWVEGPAFAGYASLVESFPRYIHLPANPNSFNPTLIQQPLNNTSPSAGRRRGRGVTVARTSVLLQSVRSGRRLWASSPSGPQTF